LLEKEIDSCGIFLVATTWRAKPIGFSWLKE
jgi:hypothetical protein